MSISVVLLAGGESRRMGQDKAFILCDGKPLWQKQVDLLRALDPLELFVSARRDPAWRPWKTTFVPDVLPSRGPLSGICAAFGLTKATHVVVLAVDMPFMSEAYLRTLFDRIEPGRGVLPMIADQAEPLAAIYPVEVCPDFTAALAGADFSLQSIVRRMVEAGKLRVIPVSKDDERLFRNMNSPLDLK
jgi:molybdenum cofactor guanylyltransferase